MKKTKNVSIRWQYILSFSGTIKLMSDGPTTPEIPILNGNSNDGSAKTVDAFIDKMLQQTMDQLAV